MLYKMFATIIVDRQNMQAICVASIMEAIMVDSQNMQVICVA